MSQQSRPNPALDRALDHEDIMRLIREADQSGFVQTGGLPTKVSATPENFRPKGFVAISEDELPDLSDALPEDQVELSTNAAPQEAPIADVPQPAAAQQIDVEAIRKAAWAEGYQAGLAEAEAKAALTAPEPEAQPEPMNDEAAIAAAREEAFAEAQAQFAEARDAFIAATDRLMTPDTDALAGLREQLTDAVRKLASDRAGVQIDTTPARFVNKIEALVETVAAGVSDVTIRLSPKDLDAVSPFLSEAPVVQQSRLIADANLRRGDVGISTPDISLTDSLTKKGAK
jgi:flagellar assembly protein FliH